MSSDTFDDTFDENSSSSQNPTNVWPDFMRKLPKVSGPNLTKQQFDGLIEKKNELVLHLFFDRYKEEFFTVYYSADGNEEVARKDGICDYIVCSHCFESLKFKTHHHSRHLDRCKKRKTKLLPRTSLSQSPTSSSQKSSVISTYMPAKYEQNHQLTESLLSAVSHVYSQKNVLKSLRIFFSIFQEALTVLQADQKPTIHLQLKYFAKLQGDLEAFLSSKDDILEALALTALDALERKQTKYRTKWSYIAILLDPASKKMSKFPVDEKIKAEQYLTEELMTISGDRSPEITRSPPAKRTLKDFDDDVDDVPIESNSLEEWYKYRDCATTYQEPLVFWQENACRYPRLAKLALKVLSLPASSASPERVFSLIKRIVTDYRFSLSGGILSKLVIAKNL